MSRRVLTATATLVGFALFAWAVRRVGAGEILDGVRRVGWGFVAILAVGGARFLVRATSWRLCMAPGTQLTLAQSFSAFLAGDAVGSVTPLGLVASEPTKVFLTRHHLATRESVASLALENLVYGLSVLTMVAVGLTVLLATVPLPSTWRTIALVILAGLIAALVLALWMLKPGPREATDSADGWRARLTEVIGEVRRFSATHPARLWKVFAFDLLCHGLAIAEGYIALGWLLGSARPTVAQAIVFEALNRAVIVAFKFVPFRVGVDEAMTGELAQLLAGNPAAGVALAVVRKVRNLFWVGVGLALVSAHPARTTK
ncbi:MAG: lysylphosphatidylglycerol synthase transmembrane domain-containing protein [Vicinamibacterales bacterium]